MSLTKYNKVETVESVESEVTERIINLMVSAQQVLDYNGENKKKFVMDQLKLYLGNETFERYMPFISITIDVIKQIAKDKNILIGLESVKKHFCFYSCLK